MNAWFSRISLAAQRLVAQPVVFALCVALIVLWGASGPHFGFSDTWQLVINTSTTIFTFLFTMLTLRAALDGADKADQVMTWLQENIQALEAEEREELDLLKGQKP